MDDSLIQIWATLDYSSATRFPLGQNHEVRQRLSVLLGSQTG